MAIIHARKIEAGDYDTDDRRQIVRVPTGMYGGMFSWYSRPKNYRKFQSEEEEEKFFCGFVLTHDRTNQRLPHFSEAIASVRTKLFFDPNNGMRSAYVTLLYALLGGKTPFEQIAGMEDVDLDEYIGYPVILFIEQNTKPDKNGLFGHKVKSMEPADPKLRAAIAPLYKDRKVETVGKDGDMKRLAFPAPALEDEAQATGNSGSSSDFGRDLDDEIPF
ncbi:MAG: hypothetical protein KGL39_34290 [Patescibacteria group bacterium]|nr:hypothetical protein [Patescibacteria group bacterium]